MRTRPMACCAVLLVSLANGVFAQTSDVRPTPAVEFLTGYAGFADDATIDHAIAGIAARVYLTPRLAIGPEVVYMWGPRSDRDLYLTGNLTFDLMSPQEGRPRRVSPFLVAGGGVFQHSDRFASMTLSSLEGAFTAGAGVRWWIADRVYALGDFRIGWELHVRVNAGVGIRLGR